MIDYWFMTQEPNYVENNWIYLTIKKPSEEEIKNKTIIVNNEKYDLINIKEMKEYLLEQNIRIKKSVNF